ncbi:MAG: ferrous iron transporter B [Cyclobacteriaceae bacterium]
MRIALVGNPNSGKTSVFNQLTGLNQKVGNYPGITVDKKTGSFSFENANVDVLDLPGIYSIYPKSRDEEVVFDILSNPSHPDKPDLVVVIVDATNLERNLLLHTQLHDIGIPCLLALNMTDLARRRKIEVDHVKLAELLGEKEVVPISALTGEGIDELKRTVINHVLSVPPTKLIPDEFGEELTIPDVSKQQILSENRFRKIHQLLGFCVTKPAKSVQKHNRADKIITHPIFGYAIFMGILFLMFQAVYAWAEWPMDLIDSVFLMSSQWVKNTLPEGVFTNLIAEGIVPGLGGVIIFIPQIALLFAFIFVLEESGYMARVVFIMDRLMRPFGLNGRSVVPMISAVACAIPAIMATRTIENWKERMITILVAPLMSCSARLPVYTLLIALVIPDEMIGIFNLKGLVLMALYLVGIFAALLISAISHSLIKSKRVGFLIMELPNYKMPRWKNAVITITEKVKLFVFEAGKVIMAISIILWVLASYGPGNAMEEAQSRVPKPINSSAEAMAQYENKMAGAALEHSYIGVMGRAIEPAIRPLGYNWQIGIALITSFAAREVFVGSMATIYSVGEDFEEGFTLINRMRQEVNADGSPLYTLASGLSLMLFYAFAMQCMSTLAVVYRETKSLKWPIIQLVYMSTLAYVAAFIAYQLLK